MICPASRGKLGLKSKKINNQQYICFEKKLSNDKSLEGNVVISRKKNCVARFLTRTSLKMTGNRVNQKPQN